MLRDSAARCASIDGAAITGRPRGPNVQGIAHGRVIHAVKRPPFVPIASVSVMPVVSHLDDKKPMVHIARQAIFDARGHVVGYELLYRGSVRDTACTVEGDVAGASVLTGAVLTFDSMR